MKNKEEIINEIKKRAKNSSLDKSLDYSTYRINNTFIRALLWVLECSYPYNHSYDLIYAVERTLKVEEHGK